MFEHVLVAVDFSPARDVLTARLPRLQDWGARRLTLAHVLSSRYPSIPAETHRAHYEAELATMAAALREAGFAVDVVLESGEPGARLASLSAERGANLILAGSRGHSVLRDFFLGSTVLDIARLTRTPLWLEPVGDGAAPREGTKHILLATDGSSASAGAEAIFIELAAQCDRALAVSVVACSEDDERALEVEHARQCLERIAARGPGIETLLPCGSPAALVAEIAEREGIDLIVVGKRGRNPIRDLLLGSTAEGLCRRATRPVLMVPAR